MGILKRLLTSVTKLSITPPTASVQRLYSQQNRLEAEKDREAVVLEIDVDADADLGGENVEADHLAVESPNKMDTPRSTSTSAQKRIRKGDVVDFLEKKNKVNKVIHDCNKPITSQPCIVLVGL